MRSFWETYIARERGPAQSLRVCHHCREWTTRLRRGSQWVRKGSRKAKWTQCFKKKRVVSCKDSCWQVEQRETRKWTWQHEDHWWLWQVRWESRVSYFRQLFQDVLLWIKHNNGAEASGTWWRQENLLLLVFFLLLLFFFLLFLLLMEDIRASHL